MSGAVSELRLVAAVAAEVAVRAGRVLRARHAMPRTVDEKGRADLVTDADRAAEEVVRLELARHFPGAHLLLEERGAEDIPGDRFTRLTFVVDPLDGTTNYAAGNPHYAVSIGVVLDDAPVIGVVHDPERDETFVAVRHEGAFLSGRDREGAVRLSVSTTARVRDAVLATGFPYTRFTDPDDNHAEFCALNLLSRGCRRNGAATLDLAWVAAGRFDGYWEGGLKPWDLVAGVVLVEEAGGRVTDEAGRPVSLERGRVVATNGHVHDEVRRALALVARERGG